MNNRFYYVLIMLCVFINAGHAQKVMTLEECKKLALRNNNTIKNSLLEIESAKKIKASAITNFFPHVSAGAMAFRANDPLVSKSIEGGDLPVYDGNPANLASATQVAYFPGMSLELFEKGKAGYVTAVQPVFAGGRIFNGNRLASLGKDVSTLKYKMNQDEILLKTEEQYWLIVSLNEKMKTIKRYEELLDTLLKQVEDSYNAGLIIKNDVLKVRQKRSEVLLNKSRLENGMQLASMAYCQYIGIPYDPAITFTDTVTFDPSPDSLRVNSSEAVKKRTEYQLLQKSMKAQKLKTMMTLGEYLPQIGVGAGIYAMQYDNSDWIENQVLFASATIPVSDWWGGAFNLQERKIQEKIESNDQEDKTRLLVLQMEKGWKDLEDAYKQLSLSEITKSQAEENLNVSRDSYNNGIVDVADLLEAQVIFQQAEDQLIEAKITYRIKQIQYLQMTDRAF